MLEIALAVLALSGPPSEPVPLSKSFRGGLNPNICETVYGPWHCRWPKPKKPPAPKGTVGGGGTIGD